MFMKKCLMLSLIAGVAFAQGPLRRDPKAVVATVDGRDLTWGELQDIKSIAPPDLRPFFDTNPQAALMQWFIIQQLGKEGAEQKLDERSPLKEELAAMRMRYLADARMNHEMNTYQVSNAQIEAAYKAKPAQYQRVRVSGIYIKFKPEAKQGATSASDIAALAQGILQGAGVQRLEAEARTLANDIVRRLRAGEPMQDLVKQYSEDDNTKAKGGDLGYITGTSSLDGGVVKAALALQVGGVSEPVKLPAGYYVLRADERDLQPLREVSSDIVEELRKEHLNEFLKALNDRFRPVIKDQTILIPQAQAK